MERDNSILAVVVFLALVLILVFAIAISGNNTFQNGQISFEYPNGWAQDHVTGNFSAQSLYSEVTLKKNVQNSNGTEITAYIILQMQQKAIGSFSLPNTSTIVMNTTNSTTVSVGVANLTAIQLANFGNNVAHKTTIIDKNNYYFTLEYITPPFAVNQTEDAYNMILQTLKIG